ncbi:MAG: HlyD family type I secretion periplasmic adaptor subunit [Inquilinus sp.]|nr:HlyD family type I secretion periplasmic adaptor subunit [Inquilinus sp.]
MSNVPQNDFDYATEVQAALHQGAPMASHVLLFTIVALIVGGLGWASWATVDEVTRGDGRVIPSSQMQVVQTLDNGILKELLVREGEIVEVGQILLRIDDIGFASSAGELEAQRRSLLVQIARHDAEVAGRETMVFPPALLRDHPELTAGETDLFRSRRQGLQSQLSILEQQIEQRLQELEELRVNETQFDTGLSLAREELAIYEPLALTGVVAEVEVLRLRREVNDLQGRLQAVRRSIPRVESAIQEARDRRAEAGTAFRSQAQAELNQRRAELAVIEQSLRAARDRVDRTDIRAPVRGIVNSVTVTTVGSVVQAGRDLVTIVPLDDTLLVEARVKPSDVAFLRPGLPATVKISAYDFSIYGGLHGRVERISANTLADTETGETFYEIVVRTDRNHLGTTFQPLPIIPGMVATVDILTGEKTVLDYLLKPLTKAREEALRER